MIKSFQHKGLEQYFEKGTKRAIRPEHIKKLRLILARLNAATSAKDMSLPGLDLHKLKGPYKDFWSVSVSGNWRIIFKFENQNAVKLDYLDHH